MPKVTVALTTYNRSQLLQRAINAVLNQTFGDFELIVMDNGSTDDTSEVVKTYKDKRIRYHRSPYNYREYGNLAFDLANGDYLLITHDDDFMDREMIETELKIIDRHPNIFIVSTNIRLVDIKGNIIRDNALKISNDKIFNKYEFIDAFFKRRLYLPMPTTLMRKDFFLRTGLRFKTGEVGEASDSFMWIETNTLQGAIYLIAKPLYSYTVHEQQDSIVSAYKKEFMFYKQIYPFFKIHKLDYLNKWADIRFLLDITCFMHNDKEKSRLDISSTLNNLELFIKTIRNHSVILKTFYYSLKFCPYVYLNLYNLALKIKKIVFW